MSVAHIDLLHPTLEDAAPRNLAWRFASVIGGIGMLALAAVPSVVAVLLFIRPDLFFSR
jgi:hypothetical protein